MTSVATAERRGRGASEQPQPNSTSRYTAWDVPATRNVFDILFFCFYKKRFFFFFFTTHPFASPIVYLPKEAEAAVFAAAYLTGSATSDAFGSNSIGFVASPMIFIVPLLYRFTRFANAHLWANAVDEEQVDTRAYARTAAPIRERKKGGRKKEELLLFASTW